VTDETNHSRTRRKRRKKCEEVEEEEDDGSNLLDIKLEQVGEHFLNFLIFINCAILTEVNS